MPEDKARPPAPRVDPRFSFPKLATRRQDDELAHDETPHVPLQKASASQAASICRMLESHGVPCFTKQLPLTEPADGETASGVQILVSEPQLDLARQLLAQPAEALITDPDEAGFEAELREEKIASWICPKCGGRPLILQPRSAPLRALSWLWLAVFASPFAVMLLDWMLVMPAGHGVASRVSDRWEIAWLVTILLIPTVFFFSPRKKECQECNWRQEPSANSI